jgi:cysteine desulfurase family protein (TIGR01976 family)
MSDRKRERASAQTTEEIRGHFPALERRHAGYPVAYFDGPGGTQVPRAVVEAMADYLYHHNANTHWAYPTSMETDEAIEYARAALADFLNAEPAEIVFGANMTTLTFHLARALGYGYGAGDEIIVTELDHHANVDSWHALARERGLTVRVVKMVRETGQLDWNDLERAVNKRTRLLAMGAASNALGTINDVRAATEMAHAAGALVFVDAVHYAPHALADVRALDCDFLGCSAYKFYGPHTGVLYAKRGLLDSIDFPRLAPAPDYAPERAETGTQNQEGMVGAAAAIDFLASLASGDLDPGDLASGEVASIDTRRARLQSTFDAFDARGARLIRQLWEGLSSIKGVKLYGPPPGERRTPTIAFTVDGFPSIEVSRALVERGIFASHGDFYAATVVERLGLAEDGLVRAGCACYTTTEECERLIDAVGAIAKN